MKTLISAQTVRDAQAKGRCCLPAGRDVLITPEARSLAEQLGLRLDPSANALEPVPACCSKAGGQAAGHDAPDELRTAVLSRLPADVVEQKELVEQVMQRVQAAQAQAVSATPAVPEKPAVPGGIKLVKESEVRLGVFQGAGADKNVGIADVITAADGAPIAAGFMAWSQSFFPWTLDYDEIDLVLDGELHVRCDGQTFVATQGDVLFIPKGSVIEFGTPTSVRFFYVTYPADWQG